MKVLPTNCPGCPGLLILLVIFLTTCITASDLEGSHPGGLFGASCHDDTSNKGDSTDTVPLEVANAALIARQRFSDIPQCALNISLPAMMKLNCPDTACICKSEPFIQFQCMEIKEACSHKDAKKAIEVGTAICRKAGVRIECKSTTLEEHPVEERSLERRHSWAFVCDPAQIKPNYQREFTRECEQKGYQCTSQGRMIRKGSRGDTLCLAACRCVSVYSNCSPSYDRPKLDFWYEYCGTWKTATEAADQGTNGPPGLQDEQPSDLIERDAEPVLGPWKIWCADADSVRDPLLTGNCQLGGKYGCDASGLVHRSRPSDACEKGCLCVQEECNQWDIECKPSQGEPLGSTSPLVEQCKQEHKCTMDGAYIRKDGKAVDPRSTCATSCYCAYSATRCLTV